MKLNIRKTTLEQILPLRQLFLQEANFQVRYDACHARNWSDSYLISANGQDLGYGAVKGKGNLQDKDAVFEFYVMPAFRCQARQAFSELVRCSGVKYIECQSNDRLLSAMLCEFAHRISSDTILFEDDTATRLPNPGAIFRPKSEADQIPWLKEREIGNYVIEAGGDIIGTGGFLLHYNPPFADLFMEVKKERRRQGFGAYLLQELKKACYQAGRVPGARCSIQNEASRACLLKAGFKIAGYLLAGDIRKNR
ncbi:MAG: GNAT family N-acetyltransferase [Lewinellaceae bacterium]|nr:GNAT family N-acetyltransferase [Phaeodactylibacter sp.]MCB9038890.1 GNAT family N-acetyltransferase [Lewinellaceae bacterium]